MKPEIQEWWDAFQDHRTINRDFYRLLPENQYDFKLTSKSDTPRRSLAHLLEVQLMYLNGIKKKKLEFKDMGVVHYQEMTKEELLSEMQKLEDEFLDYLATANLNPFDDMEAPWGKVSFLAVLQAFRDHEILHSGWNLAIIDGVGMERYKSLRRTWG